MPTTLQNFTLGVDMGKLKATLEMEEKDPFGYPDGFNLVQIAMIKAWNYAMEYDPVSGREVEKDGFHYLRNGFIQGFMAGFTHKFEQTDN